MIKMKKKFLKPEMKRINIIIVPCVACAGNAMAYYAVM
jgi:hypothetical protein